MAVLALVCGIVGYLVSWLISFGINYLWLSPAALHVEQERQIDRLRRQVSDATANEQAKTASSVTPYEEEQLKLVSDKMMGQTRQEAEVIKTLLQHGEIYRGDVGGLGFPLQLAFDAFDKGKKTLLVKEREDRHPGGVHHYLSINPVFESALKQYFEQPR